MTEEIKKLADSIEECDTKKPYIFISYSKCDASRVYPLVIELQKQGVNIWIDTRGLETTLGQNWQDHALNGIADKKCKALLFMISSNSLKSAPVFAEIMWSQDGRPVHRSHKGKSVPLVIISTDPDHNLADGQIGTTVTDIISDDDTKLNPADYDTMKYVQVIDSKLYDDGAYKVKTKGELAYEFYDCLFEQKLGGGGNVTIGNYNDIEMIIKNIPKECITAKPTDKTPSSGQAEVPKIDPITAVNDTQTYALHAQSKKAADNKSKIIIIKYENGNIYEGEFKDSKPHGQGKMTYSSGAIYEGEFKNGKPNGQGKLTFTTGDFYEGSFENGMPNGQGKITYSLGNIYEGKFKDCLPNGQGKMTYSDRSIYKGEFKDGSPNGQGKMTYTYGDIYEGEFKDGLPTGQGKETYPNGDFYEGEFKNGIPHGYGEKQYADGTIKRGKWKNGKFVG